MGSAVAAQLLLHSDQGERAELCSHPPQRSVLPAMLLSYERALNDLAGTPVDCRDEGTSGFSVGDLGNVEALDRAPFPHHRLVQVRLDCSADRRCEAHVRQRLVVSPFLDVPEGLARDLQRGAPHLHSRRHTMEGHHAQGAGAEAQCSVKGADAVLPHSGMHLARIIQLKDHLVVRHAELSPTAKLLHAVKDAVLHLLAARHPLDLADQLGHRGQRPHCVADAQGEADVHAFLQLGKAHAAQAAQGVRLKRPVGPLHLPALVAPRTIQHLRRRLLECFHHLLVRLVAHARWLEAQCILNHLEASRAHDPGLRERNLSAHPLCLPLE